MFMKIKHLFQPFACITSGALEIKPNRSICCSVCGREFGFIYPVPGSASGIYIHYTYQKYSRAIKEALINLKFCDETDKDWDNLMENLRPLTELCYMSNDEIDKLIEEEDDNDDESEDDQMEE